MEWRLRPATEADFPQIVALINSQSNEPTTLEEYQRQDHDRPKEDPFVRLVAETPGGEFAGYGLAYGGKYMPTGHFDLKVRVAERFQNQGAGRLLNQQVVAFAREHGASRLTSNVREEHAEALAWAKRQGYAVKFHVFESTLDLGSFDPTPFEDAVRAARDAGFRFVSVADLGTDEAVLRRFYEWGLEVQQDQPGYEERPQPPYEEFIKWITNNPSWFPPGVFMAMDGEQIAASAQLVKMESGGLYHGFTGVKREYRGRGLALAVKLVALRFAKEQGFPYLRTNNHSENGPMLAVNRKLGYKPEPGVFALYQDLG